MEESDGSPLPAPGALHHVEIYAASLEESLRFWKPLLTLLGYSGHQKWDGGESYILGSTYLVFVQAEPGYLDPPYHRKRPGLNHLAFHAASRHQVDEIAAWVRRSGYRILYEDRHPHAGGEGHYALFCEDPDRLKVEIVAPK